MKSTIPACIAGGGSCQCCTVSHTIPWCPHAWERVRRMGLCWWQSPTEWRQNCTCLLLSCQCPQVDVAELETQEMEDVHRAVYIEEEEGYHISYIQWNLIWKPLGQKRVSRSVRCPDFNGWTWNLGQVSCLLRHPYFRCRAAPLYTTQLLWRTFRSHPVGWKDLLILHERESCVTQIQFGCHVIINLNTYIHTYKY